MHAKRVFALDGTENILQHLLLPKRELENSCNEKGHFTALAGTKLSMPQLSLEIVLLTSNARMTQVDYR